MMKRLFALLLFSSMTLANSQNEAKVTGNTYLGVPVMSLAATSYTTMPYFD